MNGAAKKGSDEDAIAMLRYQGMAGNFSTLDNKYNVGFTKFEDRYNSATLPVCVAGFKPHDRACYDRFSGNNSLNVNLIDEELNRIFEKHGILPTS